MASQEIWTEKYRVAELQYSDHPKAVACLRKIFNSKEKVCQSFTGKLQTALAPCDNESDVIP